VAKNDPPSRPYTLRRGKHLSDADLRAFRKDVSALKKAGIVKPSLKINSAHPSNLSEGKSLRDLVKKFRAATPSGGNTAKIIPIPKADAKKFSKVDWKTFHTKTGRERVMVPAAPGSEIKVTSDGRISVKTKNGIETIHIPVEYHRIDQYLEYISRNSEEMQRMRREGEVFGFQMYGNGSKEGYGSIARMLAKLREYQSVQDALRKPNSKDARELVQNLIIIKLPEAEQYRLQSQRGREETRKQKRLARGIKINRGRPRKSEAERMKDWPEYRKVEYRKKQAEKQRVRREKKQR
jgi:hypothetical protein